MTTDADKAAARWVLKLSAKLPPVDALLVARSWYGEPPCQHRAEARAREVLDDE